MNAQNASVVTPFVTSGNCDIPENMCWKETVFSQTITDTVARFHKVLYNGRILCARVAPSHSYKQGYWPNVVIKWITNLCFFERDHVSKSSSKTRYLKWSSSWFSSVSIDKRWDSTSDYATISSFKIGLFTNYPITSYYIIYWSCP
jgi:hypothetical protein